MGAEKHIGPGPVGTVAAGPSGQPSRETKHAATVLIVDDDDAVRDSTAAILRLDFNVLEAADGTTATWIMASENVDVLLLDLHLRRLDGPAVLESLEESSTVVIFSAFGYFEETDIRQQLGRDVFGCLRKPVAPDRLVEVVASAAAHAQKEGHRLRVKPISPRMALRLALSGLARMTPESEHEEQASAVGGATDTGSGSR